MRTLLSNAQLDKLADVLINMGTVIFAVAVVPFFLVKEFDEGAFYTGVVLTFVCWVSSIIIVRRNKK